MGKFIFLLFILMTVNLGCHSPGKETKGATQEVAGEDKMEEKETDFDSLLSKRLGADDYGMRKYVLAFLKTGTQKPENQEEAKKLMQGHMKNINRMAEEGVLVVAGPFMDEGPYRGIYIFDVETIEEAEALCKTDPAVQAGSLELELHPWYCSAGLKEVNNIHNKIKKKSF